MKNNSSKYCLLLGTALLGLYFQANSIHADTTDTTVNGETTHSNVTPMVQTNKDEASTPQTTTDWSDPAKYQNALRLKHAWLIRLGEEQNLLEKPQPYLRLLPELRFPSD